MLQGIEERGGIGRDARAPGVTGTASEGQGKDDDAETATQKLYSTPICTRRGSLKTSVGWPTKKVWLGFGVGIANG